MPCHSIPIARVAALLEQLQDAAEEEAQMGGDQTSISSWGAGLGGFGASSGAPFGRVLRGRSREGGSRQGSRQGSRGFSRQPSASAVDLNPSLEPESVRSTLVGGGGGARGLVVLALCTDESSPFSSSALSAAEGESVDVKFKPKSKSQAKTTEDGRHLRVLAVTSGFPNDSPEATGGEFTNLVADDASYGKFSETSHAPTTVTAAAAALVDTSFGLNSLRVAFQNRPLCRIVTGGARSYVPATDSSGTGIVRIAPDAHGKSTENAESQGAATVTATATAIAALEAERKNWPDGTVVRPIGTFAELHVRQESSRPPPRLFPDINRTAAAAAVAAAVAAQRQAVSNGNTNGTIPQEQGQAYSAAPTRLTRYALGSVWRELFVCKSAGRSIVAARSAGKESSAQAQLLRWESVGPPLWLKQTHSVLLPSLQARAVDALFDLRPFERLYASEGV